MKNYFLLENGQNIGPFSIDQLKSKQISQSELVWCEGMQDWTKAGEVQELAELFKVTPPPPPQTTAGAPPPSPKTPPTPPPPTGNFQSPPPQNQYTAPPPPQAQQQVHPPYSSPNSYTPKPGGGWIIAGYIFAILGGLIGFAIGVHLKMGKEKLPNGSKVKKFDEKSQKHGLIILIIAIVCWILWMSQM